MKSLVLPTGFELESSKSADDAEEPETIDISALKKTEG